MQIGNFEYLNGGIDDVSLWSVALSQENIQSYLSSELNGNETGLVGMELQ